MDIDELLNILNHRVKVQKEGKYTQKLSLLEYYSLTDIEFKNMARIAYDHQLKSLAAYFRNFANEGFILFRPVDMAEKIRSYHSIGGYELTADDKLTIFEKLKQENFPLLLGVYEVAVKYYLAEGVEGISKERIRQDLIDSYNNAHKKHLIDIVSKSAQGIKVKQK